MKNRWTMVLATVACGLLFGLGLIVSGMVQPAKVLGFLDLFGAWDPSLALVMAGAIAVGLPAFTWAKRRQAAQQPALLGEPMQLPLRREPDARLVIGSLLFGVGWGLAGFCPGPALVALGAGSVEAALFVLGMLGGMLVFEWLERWRRV